MNLIRNSVSENNNYIKLVDVVGKNASEHCNTQWKRDSLGFLKPKYTFVLDELS